MIGYPKHLNSKFDYLYVKDHFPKEKWQPDFQTLLDDRMQWLSVSKLVARADGLNDETHEVRMVEGINDNPEEYYQYEYKEDENCKLFRLGFTVKEVEELGFRISECEIRN